ncbi:MAG: sensor histidine kinase N-terminal domain-containing protein, partial [Proteobacteria bacterium]|nr:sensor histidine kinase N-terminal domain-containing protein [Pseudomonadota bacterium]
MKNRTLTSHLFFRIFPVILATLMLIGVLAFRSATSQINSTADARLINNAGVLWVLTKDTLKKIHERGDTSAHQIDFDSVAAGMSHALSLDKMINNYASSRMMRIWMKDRVAMYSDTAFPEAIPAVPSGFSDITYKNEKWRVFSLPIPNQGISIELGEKVTLRQDLISDILIDLFLPLLLLMPIIGVLLWLGIRNGLQVFRSVVQQIKARSPNDLSPINISPLPDDLEPLGASINQLLLQLESSLTAERRFADHAAHQLRTPLAGLKLQLQMLATTNDEAGRRLGIRNLLSSVDRATKLVGQLLSAVRVSHQPLDMKSVPLYPLTASIVADMGTIITSKRMSVSLSGDEKITAWADKNLLRLAIINLFENAMKYTPENGTIELIVAEHEKMCSLSIRDTGPGIPVEHRESVFRRFYRINDPAMEGSGLGLAIVSETEIEVFEKYKELFDFILFMTTTPGKSGGTFNKENFKKIRE